MGCTAKNSPPGGGGACTEAIAMRNSDACAGLEPEQETRIIPPPMLDMESTGGGTRTERCRTRHMATDRCRKQRRIGSARQTAGGRLSALDAEFVALLRLLLALRLLDVPTLLDDALLLLGDLTLRRQRRRIGLHDERRRNCEVRLLERLGRRNLIELGLFDRFELVALGNEVHAHLLERNDLLEREVHEQHAQRQVGQDDGRGR